MSTVIVERTFPRPVTLETLLEGDRTIAWCASLYGVEPRLHCLSDDGLRATCIFSAPDAEALRHTIRRAGFAQPERLWACVQSSEYPTWADAPASSWRGRSMVMVGLDFAAPLSVERLDVFEDMDAAHFSSGETGRMSPFLSLDRRRMLRLYEGADDMWLRRTLERAGLDYRVWRVNVALPLSRAASPEQ